MDIKHELDCSVSVLARLLPGRPENRDSNCRRAATFLRHPSSALPKWNRGSFSGNKVLEALTIRKHGALPPPLRMLRRPTASRITLHLTRYICITFTHPRAQNTLEYSSLKSEPAGSSETPHITYQKYRLPHSNTVTFIYLSFCHYTVRNAVLVTPSPCHFHVTLALHLS